MADWEDDLKRRSAAWVAPCEAGPPAGADVRYDPLFEAVSREIGKLETPQAGALDWGGIDRDSTKILQSKSKDILVACWLAASLHERFDLDGLATGIWVIASAWPKLRRW